jgi:hypothetical protein
MQNLLTLWDRIRNFDPRKLTIPQIVIGVAVVIVALWLVGRVLALLTALVPIAILILAGFFGYRWLSSRSEQIPVEAKKSQQERAVDAAVATVTAAESGVMPAVQVAEDDGNLTIKQVINPETGFKEPDITRLVEREEQKLKEADKVNDQVMAQIEERRRRLMNDGNGSS